MKCTQCGCEDLMEIRLGNLFGIGGGDGYTNIQGSDSFKIYTCNNCGHLEFFDNGLNEKLAEEKELEKYFQEKENVLIEKQNEIRNGKLKQLQEELASVEIQLTSLDITIRQQQELSEKVIDIKEEIRKISIELYNIEQQLKRLQQSKQEEFDAIQHRYPNYSKYRR